MRYSIAPVNQIEFKSGRWRNKEIFSGKNDIEINYTDSLGNTTRLLCPIKIRIVPAEDEMQYFPIAYKLGEFTSNDQITKIILSPASPYDLTYNKSSTLILIDQNHDGFLFNSANIDTAGLFHNSGMFESDKLLMLNGSAYRIKEIALDGSYVE
ncbi:hypothetical protein JW948_09605 [bacterium]|nr:hypothetical protein [bacterium]